MSLIESFLKYKGWGESNKECNFALTPYIIADALAIAYDAYLKGRLKQEAKRHANEMMKCYDHLNKDFFRAFNEQEVSIIVDKMDYFDDYLHNDFEIFRMAIMKPLMDYPLEVRETVAGLCLCKFLAIQMDYLYSLMYRDQYGRVLNDKYGKTRDFEYIKGIKHHACEMFSAYKTKRRHDYIDLNEIPIVQESVNNIIRKTREFIDDFDKETTQG